jgi:hypothetical protein
LATILLLIVIEQLSAMFVGLLPSSFFARQSRLNR